MIPSVIIIRLGSSAAPQCINQWDFSVLLLPHTLYTHSTLEPHTDRFVRCRYCRRLSKDVHFYQHHCERKPTGYNLFYEDVLVLMHPDPAEVAAICSL